MSSRPRTFRIATRKSPLALWQANTVKAALESMGFAAELNLVVTTGDKMQRGALADLSLDDPRIPDHLKTGKGLFIKEVQEEILEGRADLAVHSMKDLPVERTAGLRVACILPRANPCDVMIFSPQTLAKLSASSSTPPLQQNAQNLVARLRTLDWSAAAPVGTTSARRQAFLRRAFTGVDLPLTVLRGNVDTRLRRVRNNEFSFIMLARAGMDRLGIYDAADMLTLPETLSLPAPAQGIVAVECRDDDLELRIKLAEMNCSSASFVAAFERTTLWLTGGSCHTALATHQNGAEMNSWAEANGRRAEFSLKLPPQSLTHWQKCAETMDHSALFEALLASDIARDIHAQLRSAGYDSFMTLRNPIG